MEVMNIEEYAKRWGFPLPYEDQGGASPKLIGLEGAILVEIDD